MFSKNSLKVALTFTGTLVGAGFASGREIALYFADCSVIPPILAAVIAAVMSYIFGELGRISGGDVIKFVFPNTHKIWKAAVILSNTVVLSAMIAGAEFALRGLTGFIGGGLLTGLLALSVVITGTERIKTINTLVVPVIIATTVLLFAMEKNFDASGKILSLSPILYPSMNILCGGLIVGKMSADLNAKETKGSAVISGLIITALTVTIYFAVQGSSGEEMPSLAVAAKYHLEIPVGIMIYLAIFTTIVGSVSVASCGRNNVAILALAIAFAASVIGFKMLVDICYPVIGVLGAVFASVAGIKLIRIRFKNNLIIKYKSQPFSVLDKKCGR